MLSDKLAWVSFWSFAVAFAVDGAVNSNNWLANANDMMDDDVPSKVTGKIGVDLKIECKVPNYELKFFAWEFCESADCSSPTAVWKMVVKVDYGEIEIFNQTKFDLAPNGSLILKDIQPSNDHNWVKCFHKEPLVGQDHWSTIIFVAAQEPVITSDNPKEYVVIENMPFVMFCEVKEGYPSPWVAWIYNGQVLQNKTNGPTYLLRRHATAEEAGIYTCKAGNMAGVTSFDYQLTVRVDCPPRESTASPQTHSTVDCPPRELTASPQTHSTVESPTVEFKATSQAPRESKGPPETHSTVQRPTSSESKLSSRAPSAGPPRKSNKKSISLGEGFAIGIVIVIVVGIALVVVWCVKRNRKNSPRVATVKFQGNSTNDGDFTSDDEAIDA